MGSIDPQLLLRLLKARTKTPQQAAQLEEHHAKQVAQRRKQRKAAKRSRKININLLLQTE